MILLERYLAQVSRYLPKGDKEDTLKELESHILDNLDIKKESGLPDSEALIKVLEEFGSPRLVAFKYKEEEPILSSQIEPLVFFILKIISITFPSAIFLATSIEYFSSNIDVTLMGLLLALAYQIPSIITTLISTLAIVFVIFVIVDRKITIKFNLESKAFDPRKLPLVPLSVYKISRFEVIFNIFASVLFLYLVNLQPGLITIEYEGAIEPLLNSNFERILPILNIGVFISLGYNIAFAIKGARTKLTGSIEFLGTIVGLVSMILLASGDIFNQVIIDGFNIPAVPRIFRVVIISLTVIAFLVAIVKFIRIMLADNK